VEAGIQKIKSMVELAIDNVKLSADPLPVILVGGGCIILNIPTSVVVPPISMTIAFRCPDKNAAPLMLFVGPDAKVQTG
jgi:hypothetical protein